MARIRTIKPEFPQSESMGRVSREARLLFVLLWTVADDSGKCRGASRMLASLLYPYDDDAKDRIEDWLDELEEESCIIRYVVDNNIYLIIPKWFEHQKIDHPSKSKHPEFREELRLFIPPKELKSIAPTIGGLSEKVPEVTGNSSVSNRNSNDDNDNGQIREDSRSLDNHSEKMPWTMDLGSGPRSGPRTNTSATADTPILKPKYTPEFARFWDVFPRLRRTQKGTAWRAWKQAIRKHDAEEIITAAVEYAASETGRGQYVVMPSTWLNGECWNDDRAAWSPTLARRASVVPTDEDNANWSSGG